MLAGMSALADETRPAKHNTPRVKTSELAYQSGGKRIQVDRFCSTGDAKRPPVILIHGADGLQFENWTQVYRKMAQRIAAQGYCVYLVHYFQRTGSKFGDAVTIVTQYYAWSCALNDAIDFVCKQPEARSDQLGLVGVSLGATLSVSVGATNPRVKCVVEYFGGTPDWLPGILDKMPPTLILHGDADKLVKVVEARKLEKALQAKKRELEIKIYPNQGHGFNGEADTDSMRRTNEFLDRYLRAR